MIVSAFSELNSIPNIPNHSQLSKIQFIQKYLSKTPIKNHNSQKRIQDIQEKMSELALSIIKITQKEKKEETKYIDEFNQLALEYYNLTGVGSVVDEKRAKTTGRWTTDISIHLTGKDPSKELDESLSKDPMAIEANKFIWLISPNSWYLCGCGPPEDGCIYDNTDDEHNNYECPCWVLRFRGFYFHPFKII